MNTDCTKNFIFGLIVAKMERMRIRSDSPPLGSTSAQVEASLDEGLGDMVDRAPGAPSSGWASGNDQACAPCQL